MTTGILTLFSFKDFFTLVYSTLGPAPVVLLALALVGLLAYFNGLPTSGGAFFEFVEARFLGAMFIGGALTALSTLVLIGLIFWNPLEGLISATIYFLPQIPLYLWDSHLNRQWDYEDYLRRDIDREIYQLTKFSKKAKTERLLDRKKIDNLRKEKEKLQKLPEKQHRWQVKEGPDQASRTYVILLFSAIIFVPAVYVMNPTLPFIGWVFFVFMLIWYLLGLSVVRGYHNQYRNSKYVEIRVVDDKKYSGYMTSVGRDHYFIIGRDKKRAIVSANIIEIYPLLPPEIDKTIN